MGAHKAKELLASWAEQVKNAARMQFAASLSMRVTLWGPFAVTLGPVELSVWIQGENYRIEGFYNGHKSLCICRNGVVLIEENEKGAVTAFQPWRRAGELKASFFGLTIIDRLSEPSVQEEQLYGRTVYKIAGIAAEAHGEQRATWWFGKDDSRLYRIETAGWTTFNDEKRVIRIELPTVSIDFREIMFVERDFPGSFFEVNRGA